MGNSNFPRHLFHLFLICAICWGICFILGVADAVINPELQQQSDWIMLVAPATCTVLFALMSRRQWKELQTQKK